MNVILQWWSIVFANVLTNLQCNFTLVHCIRVGGTPQNTLSSSGRYWRSFAIVTGLAWELCCHLCDPMRYYDIEHYVCSNCSFLIDFSTVFCFSAYLTFLDGVRVSFICNVLNVQEQSWYSLSFLHVLQTESEYKAVTWKYATGNWEQRAAYVFLTFSRTMR